MDIYSPVKPFTFSFTFMYSIGLRFFYCNVHICLCYVCCKTLTELLLKRPKVRLSAASCVSGIVVKVGTHVTRCSPGDRVAGINVFLVYSHLILYKN